MYLLSDKDKYRILSKMKIRSWMNQKNIERLPSTFIEQCRACSALRVNRIISQPYFLLGMGRLGLN